MRSKRYKKLRKEFEKRDAEVRYNLDHIKWPKGARLVSNGERGTNEVM